MVRVEPATTVWLEALVEGDEVFEARFGIRVEPDWAGFPEAVPQVLEELRAGRPAEWGTHLFFDGDDGALIGFGGWKGPPVDGAAELGYAVAPARQGRGVATEVVRTLVERARSAGVELVLAHTLPDESPSTGVLRRCGFTMAGEVADGEAVVWRWERSIGRGDER